MELCVCVCKCAMFPSAVLLVFLSMCIFTILLSYQDFLFIVILFVIDFIKSTWRTVVFTFHYVSWAQGCVILFSFCFLSSFFLSLLFKFYFTLFLILFLLGLTLVDGHTLFFHSCQRSPLFFVFQIKKLLDYLLCDFRTVNHNSFYGPLL